MGFVKLSFFLFLLLGALIYFVIPKKIRWVWLLVLSYLYYFTFSVKMSIFMVIVTLAVYLGGLIIQKSDSKLKKKMVLVGVLVLLFGMLAFVKYGALAVIGISFFTFQAASYIIDVYWGKYACEKNVFKLGLFVSFFPQIMQGPIGRYDRLKDQLFKGNEFNLVRVQLGLQRIFWGLAKKIIIADRAAQVVHNVFIETTVVHGGAVNFFALLMYSVQLYFDFSGGIDVVIGVAQIFGIKMDENFRQPYFSKSIGEFWRRWHITLGTWMKDYVFYSFSLSKPVGKFTKWGKKHLGKHVGKVLPVCFANLLIFFIVGVWHGLEARYILYGMYNGIIIAFSVLMAPVYKKVIKTLRIDEKKNWWKGFQIFRTFILVNLGWIFDCSSAGVRFAIDYFKSLVVNPAFGELNMDTLTSLGLEVKDYVIVLIGCIIMLIVGIIKEHNINIREVLSKKPIVVRWSVYYGVFIALLLFGYSSSLGFMYANF